MLIPWAVYCYKLNVKYVYLCLDKYSPYSYVLWVKSTGVAHSEVCMIFHGQYHNIYNKHFVRKVIMEIL
jgi:hypothetical protein